MADPRASTARPPRSAAPALWGDGFAGDGFASARSMTDWDFCSPDEYAVPFPPLLPDDGHLPAPLLAHLELCVAVRARRLSRRDRSTPATELRSRLPASAETEGRQEAFFVDDGALSRVARRFGLLRIAPERIAAERRLLAVLDHLLHRIQSGSTPAWTEDREAWLAFGSGIHPAYLWPESAMTPARGYTAAWLGHLDRGRRALMPEAVAEYLADAVLDGSRAVDRTLAAMVGAGEDARRLRRAAAQRIAGGDPTVRFARGRDRRVASAGGLRPATALREKAFEHA